MNKSNNKGFTILEIVSVLAILSIFAVFLVPNLSSFGKGSEVTRITSSINTIEAAVNQYFADRQTYPPDIAALMLGNYLPNTATTQDMLAKTVYSRNADGSFCITANANGMAVYSPSSKCSGETPVEEPPSDPYAHMFDPPPAGATLAPFVQMYPSAGLHGESEMNHSISPDGIVFRATGSASCKIEFLNVVDQTSGCIANAPNVNLQSPVASFLDKLYVFDAGSAAVHIYDRNTQVWTTGTGANTNLGDGSWVLVGTKMYFAGGEGKYKAALATYDTTTDTWTTIAALPTSSLIRANLAYADGSLYIVGGSNMGATVNVYNMTTNNWSTGTPFPYAVQGLQTVGVGSSIYAVDTLATYSYNTVTKAWTPGPSLPTNVWRPTYAYYNQALYVIPSGVTQKAYMTVFQ